MFLVVKFLKKEKQKFHLLILAEQKRFRIFFDFSKENFIYHFRRNIFQFKWFISINSTSNFQNNWFKNFFPFQWISKIQILKILKLSEKTWVTSFIKMLKKQLMKLLVFPNHHIFERNMKLGKNRFTVYFRYYNQNVARLPITPYQSELAVGLEPTHQKGLLLYPNWVIIWSLCVR